MDVETIVGNFTSQEPLDQARLIEAAEIISNKVKNGNLKIVELVKSLNPILTNVDHPIRLRGVQILTHVITNQSSDIFDEKEIEVIGDFMFSRMIDHKSMELEALKCTAYLIDCPKKPIKFSKDLLDSFKTRINVQRMQPESRLAIYKIVEKIITHRRITSNTIDSDLIYSMIHLIENENNPKNLIACFKMISYVLKNFEELEPFIDDLFDWLSNYFPIDYTPAGENQDSMISRSDLVSALYDCFFCSPLNSENLQTMLLENLESTNIQTKLESLDCLVKCYQVFPLSTVTKYASSLWTAIRTECLKKIEQVDQQQLEFSYRALHSLSEKLSEDDSIYFSFVSDIYSELAIAFRKPEMNLFEPALRLLVNIIGSKISGANYVIDKILPLSINAIMDNELRPIKGLTYMFHKIAESKIDAKLSPDLTENLEKLTKLLLESVEKDEDSCKLLLELIKCKINFNQDMLDLICDKLFLNINKQWPDVVEESLVMLCLNYKKAEIIFDGKTNQVDFVSLLRSIDFYNDFEKTCDDSRPLITKFSVYLGILVLFADTMNQSQMMEMDQECLKSFLVNLRLIALKLAENPKIIHDIGKLHAIFLNKLNAQLVETIAMQLFSSDYCSKLVPLGPASTAMSLKVYLPIIEWCMKALVVRNHRLFEPMVNLILNFLVSDKLGLGVSLQGAKTFSFLQADSKTFALDKNYIVFPFHKQKLFASSFKEIRIRHQQYNDDNIKSVLICALASQLPHLDPNIYRRELMELARDIIKTLTRFKSSDSKDVEELVLIIFGGMSSLISKQTKSHISSLMSSLVDVCLAHSKEAKSVKLRREALKNLKKIAQSFDQSELLILRYSVVQSLKVCLSDKKRLVRQAAADARVTWALIGQPMA